ncbi:MAG: hypothetical protein ACK5IB_06355 [Qingshengfaniella sp.]
MSRPVPIHARFSGTALRRMAILLGTLVLSACSTPLPTWPGLGTDHDGRPDSRPPPIASVRHLASTEPYQGGRLYLFVFTPEAPRPLDIRIRAARTAIANDPKCTWIDAPTTLIETETAKQGAAYAETLLVAPLRCT